MTTWQPGDILCCYGTDLISRVIRVGTSWPLDPWSCFAPPSHVGLIGTYYGETYSLNHVLVESTTLCRSECLVAGERKSGIQVHHPADRIAEYTATGGRVDVYRLVGLHRMALDDQLLNRSLSYLVHASGNYDKLGAILSGSRLSGWLRWTNADLRTLFCSEMIAAVLMTCGLMNRENPMKYSPGRLLREMRRTGIYELVRSETLHCTRFPGGAHLRLCRAA